MRDHVIYESRLELARLLMVPGSDGGADLCSAVPSHSNGRWCRAAARSGLSLVHRDGGVTVVDVKPRARLSRPAVAEALAWSRGAIAGRGWGYEVWSEPDPQLLANVRFLAAYRRPEMFDSILLEMSRALATEPISIRSVEARLTRRWPALSVRPHCAAPVVAWRSSCRSRPAAGRAALVRSAAG
jgi:hypothetical protein